MSNLAEKVRQATHDISDIPLKLEWVEQIQERIQQLHTFTRQFTSTTPVANNTREKLYRQLYNATSNIFGILRSIGESSHSRLKEQSGKIDNQLVELSKFFQAESKQQLKDQKWEISVNINHEGQRQLCLDKNNRFCTTSLDKIENLFKTLQIDDNVLKSLSDGYKGYTGEKIYTMLWYQKKISKTLAFYEVTIEGNRTNLVVTSDELYGAFMPRRLFDFLRNANQEKKLPNVAFRSFTRYQREFNDKHQILWKDGKGVCYTVQYNQQFHSLQLKRDNKKKHFEYL